MAAEVVVQSQPQIRKILNDRKYNHETPHLCKAMPCQCEKKKESRSKSQMLK